MKSTIGHPLKRSILIGCVLFVFVLCLTLGIVNYFSLKDTLYGAYEEYAEGILHHVSHHIDADDLEKCIETGQKSEKYDDLQELLDCYKDNVRLDYIYIVIPLSTEDGAELQKVINGVSSEEYAEANFKH